MKITVKNCKLFSSFLKSINQFSGGCEFIFNPTGCEVKGINPTKTLRAFFVTNCAVGDNTFSFCMTELNKLQFSIEQNCLFSEKNTIELDYDTSKVSYKSKRGKFSLLTVDRSRMMNFITENFKVKINDTYGFKTKSSDVKKLLSSSSICSSANPNIYISKEDIDVIIEINDKSQNLCDSIALPLTQETTGEWTNAFCLPIDSFRLTTVLNSENITVSMTDRGIVHIASKVEDDKTDFFIKADMYATTLQG